DAGESGESRLVSTVDRHPRSAGCLGPVTCDTHRDTRRRTRSSLPARAGRDDRRETAGGGLRAFPGRGAHVAAGTQQRGGGTYRGCASTRHSRRVIPADGPAVAPWLRSKGVSGSVRLLQREPGTNATPGEGGNQFDRLGAVDRAFLRQPETCTDLAHPDEADSQ